MAGVRIVTDSGADIDPSTAEALGISVVPLTVLFGTETYLHSEISNDDFWRKVDAGQHPGTSQPAIGLFEEAFARLVQAGHQVLCLTITGQHSGTFSSAWAAARPFGGQVKVMDSLSLSLGQGFQVLAAARAAIEGLGLEQVSRLAERVRERTHLLILLDTIEHIRRGGRADALIPALNRVTKVLGIKPILSMPGGRLGLHGLARSFERGVSRLKQDIVQLRPLEHLAVMHIRCAEVAHRVARALADALAVPLEEIVVGEAGPVLAVHGGPNVVGVIAVQAAN